MSVCDGCFFHVPLEALLFYYPPMELLTPGILFLLCIVLFSSFVKIFTTLSILSAGIGMRGAGFGAVIAGLSLLLSWLVIQPYLGGTAVSSISQAQTADILLFEERLKPFMEKQTNEEIKGSVTRISQKIHAQANQPEQKTEPGALSVLGASFMITQLRDAFYLGLIFLIPFVVIDLVVTNILMLLGITQLSSAVVALPVKILLFVAVDGWTLVSERLLGSFLAG